MKKQDGTFNKNPRNSSGYVTRQRDYQGEGLAKTDKYSIDKKPLVNPRVSTPSDVKEELEPGSRPRV